MRHVLAGRVNADHKIVNLVSHNPTGVSGISLAKINNLALGIVKNSRIELWE